MDLASSLKVRGRVKAAERTREELSRGAGDEGDENRYRKTEKSMRNNKRLTQLCIGNSRDWKVVGTAKQIESCCCPSFRGSRSNVGTNSAS